MGQQQLLLLVLGMVIVGIAVVAGIEAFSEGKDKADRDAAISDAMRIISDVQAWKLKPVAFGGGANGTAADFADVSLQSLGITPNDGANYKTLNGCYSLAGTATKATVTVYNSSGCSAGNEIATVDITGTTTDAISWAYSTSSS